MKKILTFLILLMGFVGSSWGDEVSFSPINKTTFPSQSTTPRTTVSTSNGITATFSAGAANLSDANNDGYQKMVKGNTLTISSGANVITAITISYVSTYGIAATNNITVNPGKVTVVTDKSAATTWSGSSNSITFTDDATNGKDLRVSGISVTYSTSTDPSISFSSSAAGVKYGSTITKAVTANNMTSGSYSTTYAASPTNIATIDNDGTVHPTATGTATVKATTTYNSNTYTASYTPTVDKGDITLNLTENTISPTVGTTVDGNTVSSATNQAGTEVTGLSYTYNSGSESVATVGSFDGKVKGVSVGTAQINAVFAGNDYYYSSNASYSVNVAKGSLTLSAGTSSDVAVKSKVSAPTITAKDASNATISSGITYSYAITSGGSYATINSSTGELTGVAAGTATVTVTATSDNYTTATTTYNVKVTRSVAAVTLGLSATEITKTYNASGNDITDATPTLTATSNSTDVKSSLTFTYSSSNTSVASVDGNGNLTIHPIVAGKAVITITSTATTSSYSAATISYTVYVRKTATIAFTGFPDEASANSKTITTTYGHAGAGTYPTVTFKADGTNVTTVWGISNLPTSADGLKFTSSNVSVATINATTGIVTLVGTGSTKLTVSKAAGDDYASCSDQMTLTVNKGTDLAFDFLPKTSKLNIGGKTLRLRLAFPSGKTENEIGNITLSQTINGTATSVLTLGAVSGISSDVAYVTITSPSTLTTIDPITITATTAGGTQYASASTTCTVTLTAADAVNFGFVNGSGSMYVGDFIAIPGISGNGTYCSQTYSKTFNSTSDLVAYHSTGNANVPIYTVSDASKAAIYYAAGQSSTTDTLLVYAKAAGDVTITATDAQTNTLTATYKLTINSALDDATALNNISYPYTWDFTKEVDAKDIDADKNYWVDNGTYYSANLGYYNLAGINTGTRSFKKFSANNSLIVPFKGLQISIAGSTNYMNKVDRIRLNKSADRTKITSITFNGGDHVIQLPDATNRESQTSNYRIFVKAKGNSGYMTYKSSADASKTTNFVNGTTAWYSVPVTKGSTSIQLGFNNCEVYDICVSTEAKQVKAFNYATYAYDTDMDLTLTKEATHVLTYAATVSGNTVNLTEVNKVAAGQGVVLVNPTDSANAVRTYFFLANAKNVDTYAGPTVATNTSNAEVTNNLVGVTEETSITGGYKSGSGETTNYILSNTYFDKNNANTKGTGVAFYVARTGGVKMPAHSAYLPITNANAANGYYLISFDDEDVTGIEDATISNDNRLGDGYYYNLNGMRVTNPSKGIFIHNGKKIVIK